MTITAPLQAQTISRDCTQASVDFVDDSLMSKAERLAAMEDAFNASLENYEECVMAERESDNGSGVSSDADGSEAGANAASSGGGQIESVPDVRSRGTSLKPRGGSENAPANGTAAFGNDLNDPLQNGAPDQGPDKSCPETKTMAQMRKAMENASSDEEKRVLLEQYNRYKKGNTQC